MVRVKGNNGAPEIAESDQTTEEETMMKRLGKFFAVCSCLLLCCAVLFGCAGRADLLGAPKGFTVTVRNLKVCAGAGFIVALTGDIMTMPGLPKVPSAEKIDVDENGVITGLF